MTRLCSRKTTSTLGVQLYARKSVSKHFVIDSDTRIMEEVKVEVVAMKHLAKRFRHGRPNIARLVEVFEDEDAVHLILEYYSGVDLFDYVMKNGPLTEGHTLGIMRGVMRALKGCHVAGVMHRDVKLDNVMLTAPNPKSKQQNFMQVKLIDFGLSKLFKSSKESFTDAVGTIGYMAPEVLSSYGIQADIWSVGICLFTLLDRKLPSFTRGIDVELDDEPRIPLSYAAKDILRRMFHADPAERMTIHKFFKYPWVQNMVSMD